MKVARAAAAVLTCMLVLACAEPTLVTPSGVSRLDLFDTVWSDFDLRYSMFALKKISWDSIERVYRPQAAATTSDSALARVLGAMMSSLHDRHVYLTPGAQRAPIIFRSSADTALAGFDATVVGTYLGGGAKAAGPHVVYGNLTPALGYVRIASFEGDGWVAELDSALAVLAGSKAIAIDVRGNGGGSYTLALSAAGRFADRARVFGSTKERNGPNHDDFTALAAESVQPAGPRQFRGSVFVLTNRRVYSAGENFVLALSTIPGVLTIGDTTGGSTGKPVVRELANGWTYQLSTWVEYTAGGSSFEDRGLGPNIYVRSQLDDLRRNVDPVLDAVIFRTTRGLAVANP